MRDLGETRMYGGVRGTPVGVQCLWATYSIIIFFYFFKESFVIIEIIIIGSSNILINYYIHFLNDDSLKHSHLFDLEPYLRFL